MFIDVTRRRNPDLIDAAVSLHRAGEIPSNCYIIDLDTVSANAAVVAAAARSHGLTPYQMTKQFGRNPIVARASGCGCWCRRPWSHRMSAAFPR